MEEDISLNFLHGIISKQLLKKCKTYLCTMSYHLDNDTVYFYHNLITTIEGKNSEFLLPHFSRNYLHLTDIQQ